MSWGTYFPVIDGQRKATKKVGRRNGKMIRIGGLVDESPANFYLFFYSGGILKIRGAKKKRKNKRTTD